MNSTRSLLGSLSVLALLAGFACDSQTREQSSSSTHWVTCDTNQDCAAHPSHPTCDAGYCVNDSGERLEEDPTTGGRGSVPEATGGNAPSFGGALNPTTGGSSPVASGGAAVSGAGGEPAGGTSSSTEGGAAASQAGAGGEETGGSDGGSSTGGGSSVEPGSACSGQEPYARPDLDKTCETSSDCFAGPHLVDCCGTTLWLSYSEAARADFEQAESGCTATCPCPIGPTRAEDGAELVNRTDAVADCVDGRCIARHPDNVGECLGSKECIDLDTGFCLDADGPLMNGICRGAGGVCFLCECASPDTPIATPKGDVAISELRAGDLVYSIDGAAIRAVPIAAIHRNPVEHHRMVEVRLESGAVLALSASHPIADGRTFADLRAGTLLGDSRIASVRLVPYAHPFTYDILPDSDTGAYFVAGAALGSTLRLGPAQSLPH